MKRVLDLLSWPVGLNSIQLKPVIKEPMFFSFRLMSFLCIEYLVKIQPQAVCNMFLNSV